jgi:hypothetical protein
MWNAIAFIERNPSEVGRQLDAAFENDDGDAMAAALYKVAERRPKLAALLPKYVIRPSETHCARVLPLMGKPMSEIRKAAAEQRRQGQASHQAFVKELEAKRQNAA